ncbi:MAG: response regulator [Nitrococcus sp.]|nr:response regulator [Nitrococcus sp.]
MDDKAIPAYRFPSTVLVIDDDATFLTNLSLELDEGLAYRLFDSPRAALEHLQRREDDVRPYQRCLHQHRESVGWPIRDHLQCEDVAALQEVVTDPKRFSEISVVVVDYVMPGMNGLELCQHISNPDIRKILFTGVGDEKVAVEGFNKGLIDRFIRKGWHNVAADLNQSIKELQAQHFQDATRLLQQSLDGDEAAFLQDPVFIYHFERLCEEYRLVEHYQLSEPNGFLLISDDGRPHRLVVLTDEDLQVHREVIRDQGGPEPLLDKLASGSVVPYFWRSAGYYRPECLDWENSLYPAKVLCGAQRYYLALIDEPPLYRKLGWQIASYRSFLDELDATLEVPSV